MAWVINTTSPEATRAFGQALGKVAIGPLALLLTGDYGTGKTTFAQGLAAGLGVTGPVRSPSYNIMKIYPGGRLTLVHADLYRTASVPEIEELGLTEAISESGILAMEWPGKFDAVELDMPRLLLTFSYTAGTPDSEDDGRRIEVEADQDCLAVIREVLDAFAAR